MSQYELKNSVGNEFLDCDHRSFDLICQLLSDAGMAGDRVHIIQSCMSQLKDYLSGHFYREESALRSVNYPDLENHISAHVSFEIQVRDLISAYENGDKSALLRLATFARTWQDEHLTADHQYKDWIQGAVVDSRPLAMLAAEVSTYYDDGDARSRLESNTKLR